MRVRQLVLVFVVVASSLGSSGPAAACKICDQTLHCCEIPPPGARVCLEGALSCGLLLPCFEGGRRIPDGGEEYLTTWTLFDSPVGSTPRALPMRAALRSEAGDLSLGEEARASAGADAPAGALADATLAFGDEFAVSLVDGTGSGFAIRRSDEGGRVRLEVRDVTNDVPGSVLASESLGPRDQLRVPVRVDGRDRVLLLQAVRVRGGGGPFEVARLRRALAAAGRTMPARTEPLLHAHPQ